MKRLPPLLAAALMALVLALPLSAQYPAELASPGAAEQLRLGVTAYHQGRFAESILLFEKALAYEPAAPVLRYWLGRAYYKSGYEATALRTWEALVAEPEAPATLRAEVERLRGSRALDPADPRERQFVETASFEGRVGRATNFLRPSAILPRADGSFLVVAHGSNEILRIDANGVTRDRDRGGIPGYDRPFGIAELSDGTLFVTEFNGDRVSRNGGGTDKVLFGSRGRGPGQLLGPQYAATDRSGYLYVTDYGNARVVKFSPAGEFVLAFGAATEGFGGFVSPTGIAVIGERIFVADSSTRSIHSFDASGNHLGELAAGLLHAPEGLSASGDGRTLIVADTDRVVFLDLETETPEVIYRAPESGAKLVGAVIDRNGNLIVCDFDRNVVRVLADSRLLAAGYDVEIERVDAQAFPKVRVELRVRDAEGKPVVGLDQANFYLTERLRRVERISDRGQAVDRRTETSMPVSAFEFLGSGDRASSLKAVLLLERGPLMDDLALPARKAMEELLASLGSGGAGATAGRAPAELGLVAAERSPVLVAPLSAKPDGREYLRNLLARGARQGRFDLGLRLAANSLLPGGARNAVIYLGSGQVDPNSFQSATLSELAALLQNNGIRFYGVILGDGAPSQVLSYLATQTGGKLYASGRPGGLAELVEEAFAAPGGLYALSFSSQADSGFGANLLSVAAEAYLYKRSGRDELGYFAPLR